MNPGGIITMYTPKPIDTTKITLPEELLELTEKIAENVHEVWSLGRIKDGWTYGEERNDAEKKHPCLVPYDQLTETEKDFDRNTALETIKLIVALGYRIEK
jgi:ryanodine receptor 2